MFIDRNTYERNVRTVIVSDVHLGCRFAQAENFLAYLQTVRPEHLYILGDFFDGWALTARWRWEAVYSQIIDRIFDLAATGTELYYTPGNHDAFLRCPQVGQFLSRSGVVVNIQDEFVFETLDGRRLLLLHGDQFDVIESQYQWLSVLLTYAYEPLLSANWLVNRFSGRDCSPYRGCAVVKNKVKTAVRFFSHFEEQLKEYARQRNCDGAICGHIHTPTYNTSSGFTYINTGDWVENCTGLVEFHTGELVLESFYASHPLEQLASTSGRNRLPLAMPAPLALAPLAEGAA